MQVALLTKLLRESVTSFLKQYIALALSLTRMPYLAATITLRIAELSHAALCAVSGSSARSTNAAIVDGANFRPRLEPRRRRACALGAVRR